MWYFALALISFLAGVTMSFHGQQPSDHIKAAANGIGTISAFYIPISGIAAYESEGYAHYWLVVGIVGLIIAFALNKLAKSESSSDPIFN